MVFYECGNAACGAAYAVFLYGGCPRCGSMLFEKEGLVPKTNLAGASNAAAAAEQAAAESAAAHAAASADATAGAVAEDDAAAHADASVAEAGTPARPASAAPKADWVAWAIGAGLSEADAEGMKKTELMAWDPYPAPGDASDTAVADVAEAQVVHEDGTVS